MNIRKFSDIKITGIAAAVPTNVSINKVCDGITERDLKRFVKNVGVEEKRLSIREQTSSDLAFVAAEKILSEKSIDRATIGSLIFITQNPDYFNPSTAYVLSYRLGLNSDCICFDVNLGCSAFVYGTNIAASLLIDAPYDRSLVLIGDVAKRGFGNERDNLLFGDCGCAILMEKRKNSIIKSCLKSDGSRYMALYSRGGMNRHPITNPQNYFEDTKASMNGEDVFNFSVTDVPETINEFLLKTEQKVTDFDYVLLHQANLMMVNMIIDKIGAEKSRVPISMRKFGNVNGSSIPLTLVDLKEKETLTQSLNLLSSGFGIGLSWGVNSFEIESSDIFPLIETDEYYKEAF